MIKAASLFKVSALRAARLDLGNQAQVELSVGWARQGCRPTRLPRFDVPDCCHVGRIDYPSPLGDRRAEPRSLRLRTPDQLRRSNCHWRATSEKEWQLENSLQLNGRLTSIDPFDLSPLTLVNQGSLARSPVRSLQRKSRHMAAFTLCFITFAVSPLLIILRGCPRVAQKVIKPD